MNLTTGTTTAMALKVEQKFASVEVLGVRVHCVRVADLLQTVLEWSGHRLPRTILYVNAHCLNVAWGDREYHTLLNQADLVYPDGISVVWSGRLLAGCQMQKITGADWIYDFSRMAVEHDLRAYFLAGNPGVAHQARRNLLQRFPDLQVVGFSDGYFTERHEMEVFEEIDRLCPQVVFVGMGTPIQEKWLAAHRQQISAPVCWAVGAMFDFVAGIEPRVPPWMNRLYLEWLWRLMIDPRSKWRRYLFGNPLFVYRILRQKIRG